MRVAVLDRGRKPPSLIHTNDGSGKPVALHVKDISFVPLVVFTLTGLRVIIGLMNTYVVYVSEPAALVTLQV